MTTGKGRLEVDGKLTYQKRKLDVAVGHAKNRRVALDIGAHVGLWSMWLCRLFQHVVAFEPVPDHAELFQRNVPGQNVHLHRVALGNGAGLVDMQVPEETTGNAHVAIPSVHPGTRGVAHPDRIRIYKGIELRTLDSFNLAVVDFIKIDVEGFERAVLEGAKQTILRTKPVIVIEQKGNESAYGDGPNAALKLLQSWGGKIKTEISGDYILSFEGCGCGNRREAIKTVIRKIVK